MGATAGVVVGSGSLRMRLARYGDSVVKLSVVIWIPGVNAWDRTVDGHGATERPSATAFSRIPSSTETTVSARCAS